MTFKIQSRAVIYTSEQGSRDREEVVVYQRERVLKPGEVVEFSGSIRNDPEEKFTARAEGELRVIDETKVGITWIHDRNGAYPFTWTPDSDFSRYYREQEKILEGQEAGPFSINEDSPPKYAAFEEVFNPLERKILIPILMDRKIGQLPRGVFKYPERETKLIYEPTLPPQSRR